MYDLQLIKKEITNGKGKLESRDFRVWADLCKIPLWCRFIDRDTALQLLKLAKKNGYNIDPAAILDAMDEQGISRRSVILDLEKKYKIDRSNISRIIRNRFGAARDKPFLDYDEVDIIEDEVKKINRKTA